MEEQYQPVILDGSQYGFLGRRFGQPEINRRRRPRFNVEGQAEVIAGVQHADGEVQQISEYVKNGGQVVMAIEGRLGRAFYIEGSNDLQNWSPVAALVNLDGLLQFVDPAAVDFQQLPRRPLGG